jgi:hypothetical protein
MGRGDSANRWLCLALVLGSCQATVLVHMISDTFESLVWICCDAAGTPAEWRSQEPDGDGWCCRSAPRPAIDDPASPAIRRDFIELLVVGAMGAFDMAIEFGRARREYEQRQAPSLAGLLEFGGEFAANIDLHGADGEGHAAH